MDEAEEGSCLPCWLSGYSLYSSKKKRKLHSSDITKLYFKLCETSILWGSDHTWASWNHVRNCSKMQDTFAMALFLNGTPNAVRFSCNCQALKWLQKSQHQPLPWLCAKIWYMRVFWSIFGAEGSPINGATRKTRHKIKRLGVNGAEPMSA